MNANVIIHHVDKQFNMNYTLFYYFFSLLKCFIKQIIKVMCAYDNFNNTGKYKVKDKVPHHFTPHK